MLRASATTVHRARELRRQMTLPEVLLWRAPRQRPGNLKFRKQHPAGTFVLDFYCAEAKLCVKVDGELHNRSDQPQFDASRDAWLRLHEMETACVVVADVLTDLDSVVTHLVETARARLPLHQPSAGPPPHAGPRAGEELGSTP